MSGASEHSDGARTGLALALAAYLVWGASPLFWRLLDAGAWEIVAHRCGWALILLTPIVAASKPDWRALFTIRRLKWAAVGALLIGSNWLVFIWAATHDRVLEASLGYFIGPLVNVVLGVALLRERLSGAQKIAIALAALGVAAPILADGRVPLIALYLAVSFALYAFVRKRLDVGGAAGLFLECLLIAPAGLVGVIWFEATGRGHFLELSWQPVLLIAAGVVFTAGVLLVFILAARRLSMSALGLLQYIAPTLQFAIGLLLGEPFPASRAVAFALIWAGLAIYTVDFLRHHRLSRAGRRASPVG